jgi:hypothetical protein
MKHYFGVVLKPQRIVAREIICTNLVKDMIDPIHKLHDLLPFTVNRIRGREIVFAIDKYNLSMH